MEKEARFRQLMAHSSHDSAIDTDSMEWETEVVEFEKHRVRTTWSVNYFTLINIVLPKRTESFLLLFQDMDLKALGFDIAEGVNDPYIPGDCGIFVSKVDKGSIAEGRLRYRVMILKNMFQQNMADCAWRTSSDLFSLGRVNDWLLKINDVDLTNKDRKQVIKAVLSGEGVINLVVRRRKSLGGRILSPIQINLAGHKG